MKKPSLNHIYRLVWNDALGVYVPVAEHASARRKRNAGGAAALSAALLLSGPALAADLPTGGNVVAGSGSISQNGNAMTVNQHSGKMAVDWQSFSIGKGKSVTFNQPGRDSVALNRVLGPDVSVIQGALNANGQVFLVNPNGVVFTPSAQVNVGGIVASTLNISTQDFLAGNYRFEGGSSNAIVNQGNITAAPGGSIALIAARITNTGNLTADKGNVLLGAGSRVKLDLGGPVKIEVEQGAIDALIEQGGAIRADGGVVYLTAKAAGDLASTVINHTGITQARTLATGENGKIALLGDMVNDRVAVAGTLDASAPNGGKGGFVETSAAKITVAKGAVVTTKAASGQHGAWLVDPTDFTVSAGAAGQTDSGIGADTLSANLNNGNIELQTIDGGDQAGNINVNAGVAWSADTKLTLSSHGSVAINAPITATGRNAGLELNLGGFKQRGYSSGGSYAANAPITLSGAEATFKVNGQGFTLLHSLQDLQAIGQSGYGFYALAQDLDLKGNTFSSSIVTDLRGSLAGLGHTIDNLTINSTGSYLGLIGRITSDGEVRDLSVTNASITGRSNLGPLAGSNEGTIRNASASGSVVGDSFLGGLVGNNSSNIVGASARTTVTSTNKGYALGGLAGSNSAAGSIENAYATGNVAGGNSDTGGLVGINSGAIRNAYAIGNVDAAEDGLGLAIGGLVGSARDNSIVSNVHATGRVTGKNLVGGVVGMFSGSGIVLENAQWDAATTGQANAVGGGSSGSVSGTGAVANALSHGSYANLGTWSQIPGTDNVWVAKDAAGKAQWIMVEGMTRPFLASEYSLAVSNDHQLQLMAADLSAHYNIVRDIDAKATSTGGSGMWQTGGFSPIGGGNQFMGSLNGNGHTISNLTVGNYLPYAGLFGTVGSSATIRNIGLDNVTVNGFMQAGGLAAMNLGTIDNVYANGHIRTNGLGNGTGGLVGMNHGSISNAYTSGTVSTDGPLVGNAGGLVGLNYGTISKTYSTSTISSLFMFAGNGALVGYNAGTVNDSFAASTDASGNPASGNPAMMLIGANGGTVNAASGMRTYQQLTQLSTFLDAGWDIDNAGGTGATWRMYEGNGTPLLRGFLKQVTVSLADKVYNGQVSGGADYIASEAGAQLGGALEFTTSSKNAGTYRLADGTLTVNGGLYSDQRGYDIIYADGLSLNVLQKGVSAGFTAGDKVYDGTTGATVNGTLGAGVIAGDDIGVSGAGSFGDKNVGSGKTVIVGGVALTGADAGNYFIDNVSTVTTANIAAKVLDGTVIGANKVYDGNTVAFVSGGLSGAVGGDSLALVGNFVDKNVGLGKLITVGLIGADAGNYVLGSGMANVSASITPRTITGAITASGKVYDGTLAASTGGALSGVLAGDAVSLSTSGSFADKNAGVGKMVNVGGTLSGADAGNYVLAANATTTADITPKALTGAITASGKVYDGTLAASTGGTLSGVLLGDIVWLSTTGAFADKNVGSGKTVAVGGTLSGLDAGNYALSANATATADITPKALTGAITAAGKTYDGTTAATTSGQLTGVVAGDLVALSTAGVFADKNVGTGKRVDVSGALVGTDAGNYTVSANASTTASIAARQLTGALGALDKVYDGLTAASVTGAGSLNVVSGDELSVSGSFADRNVGNGKAVAYALSGADAGNYVLGSGVAQGAASITPRTITGAITAAGKVYDGTLAASTGGTLSGVLLGDVVSLSTTGVFADKNVGSGKTVTVGGALSGLDAGNYALSVNGTATADITPKTITGALTAASKVYDGTLTAITTGTLSGVVLGDAVAINGTGLFADKNVGAGKAVAVGATLTGLDAGNYLLVANSTAQADITPKALTGAITAAGKTYDGTTAATTSGQLSGVVAGDLVALSTAGVFADKNAGTGKRVDVSGALVGADAGNYTVSANASTTASIAARQLTGALGAQDKVYDGSSVASVLGADAIQGIIAGDDLGFAGAFADKNAGERKAVAFSLTGEDAGNYVLNAAQARATIARRVLGIDGTVVDGKIYDGGTDARARTGSLTNLVAGETLGVSATARYDSADAGERNATVQYALADSGTGLAGNYVLANTQHRAVIDRRAITVAADDKTKRAGEADPALTWRVTQGTLVGDDTLAGALSRAPGETAGSYLIGAGGLGNANYRIAAVDGTLLIENAVQSDTRREASLSAVQSLRAAVGAANSTEPDLSGGLDFVPVSSGGNGQGANTPPAPNAGQGARAMQGPAQVLVIDGGIRLPEDVVRGGI